MAWATRSRGIAGFAMAVARRQLAPSRTASSAAGPHRVEVARIIPAPADKAWAEMRDFVGQMRHFGLEAKHANPGAAATDEVGCERLVFGSSDPLRETMTAHSDGARSFSLELGENKLGIDNYKAHVSVTQLSDGSALGRYSCTFVGDEDKKELLSTAYMKFFDSVGAAARERRMVRVSQQGGPALAGGRLAGKRALVTGGAQGIGEAISRRFASEGAQVIIADLSGAQTKQVASEIPGGWSAEVDVTQSDEVAALFQEASAALGGLDIVVNNAGIAGLQEPMHEHSLENWHAVIDVNLNGAFYVLRAALAQMKSQEPSGGVILNMGSVVGLQGWRDIPAYAAAKAALIHLTRCAACSYAEHGIRAVAIAPTAVMTKMAEGFLAAAPEEVAQGLAVLNPKPGFVELDDVAAAALFLASDEAKWISGSVVPIDGAYCAGTIHPHTRGKL